MKSLQTTYNNKKFTAIWNNGQYDIYVDGKYEYYVYDKDEFIEFIKSY